MMFVWLFVCLGVCVCGIRCILYRFSAYNNFVKFINLFYYTFLFLCIKCFGMICFKRLTKIMRRTNKQKSKYIFIWLNRTLQHILHCIFPFYYTDINFTKLKIGRKIIHLTYIISHNIQCSIFLFESNWFGQIEPMIDRM